MVAGDDANVARWGVVGLNLHVEAVSRARVERWVVVVESWINLEAV